MVRSYSFHLLDNGTSSPLSWNFSNSARHGPQESPYFFSKLARSVRCSRCNHYHQYDSVVSKHRLTKFHGRSSVPSVYTSPNNSERRFRLRFSPRRNASRTSFFIEFFVSSSFPPSHQPFCSRKRLIRYRGLSVFLNCSTSCRPRYAKLSSEVLW